MHKITEQTKNRAIEILTKSLKTNPGTLGVMKNDHKFETRLNEFCTFCINISILKKGAYITSDHKGVALMFNSKTKAPILPFISTYLRLGSRCIGWDRVIPILWKQRTIKKKRPKMEHLHFWILAVEDNSYGLRTIIEIRDFTYGISTTLGLPIFAETRLERNKALYERYGFKTFDSWRDKSVGTNLWYLMRNPR